jgi:hypothetical protein
LETVWAIALPDHGAEASGNQNLYHQAVRSALYSDWSVIAAAWMVAVFVDGWEKICGRARTGEAISRALVVFEPQGAPTIQRQSTTSAIGREIFRDLNENLSLARKSIGKFSTTASMMRVGPSSTRYSAPSIPSIPPARFSRWPR